MKRLAILAGSLFTLGLATFSPAALASEVAVVSSAKTAIHQIQPFNLVHRAYSGHFSQQGIPGFNGLTTAYRGGEIEAEDLVEVAISQGRLSPETLTDEAYLKAVEFQLRDLQNNQGDSGN